MRQLSHTKEIFEQLADTDGAAGVQTIIENHDAWVQNAATQTTITAAIRAQLSRAPRSEIHLRRIARQKASLAKLVTVLPIRLSSAG